MKKHIPNTITCMNLFSGCIACLMAFKGNLEMALLFIIIAAVFDFFDGFAARLLKAYSNIGKELDSLADMVSFGLAPGLIIYSYLTTLHFEIPVIGDYIAFLAFLIPIFSALRLAKFNVDERQTSSFIGLPVPANALFWGSFIPSLQLHAQNDYIQYIVLLLIFLFSYLMISELPMFSLKFKNYRLKGNEPQYILICTAIVSFILLWITGICITICVYILMSLFIKIFQK